MQDDASIFIYIMNVVVCRFPPTDERSCGGIGVEDCWIEPNVSTDDGSKSESVPKKPDVKNMIPWTGVDRDCRGESGHSVKLLLTPGETL